MTYIRCRIDTVNSPDDGHMAARNMQRIEINIHEKIMHQVGYLQRLYRDARSTEQKIVALLSDASLFRGGIFAIGLDK